MAYQIYDASKTYVLPNGKEADADYLAKDFPLIRTVPYAMRGENGTITELTMLSVLKGQHGVTDSDPQDAIDAVNAAIDAEYQAQLNAVTNSKDIQAQLDALAGIEA